MNKLSIVLAITLFVTGCAFSPHNANITMDLPTSASVTKISAQGTPIYLQVVDERDKMDIGQRGRSVAGAKITAEGFYYKILSSDQRWVSIKGL